MTWVKICGTTTLRDAQTSLAAGANALGFIFAPSPREVEVAAATTIIAALPKGTDSIGVFVNATIEHVSQVAQQAGLTGVQLHGNEAAGQLRELRPILGARKIFKALSARELAQNPRKLDEYLAARSSLDAILLDSGSPEQRGGTGLMFAWDEALPIAREIRQTVPLIIAGGLNAQNVARAIDLFEPSGVDVVSGVERKPGEKDEAKLREFITAVRQGQVSASRTE